MVCAVEPTSDASLHSDDVKATSDNQPAAAPQPDPNFDSLYGSYPPLADLNKITGSGKFSVASSQNFEA